MNNLKSNKTPTGGINKLKEHWPEMTLFDRFEYIVMLFVSCLLAIIIVITLFRLVENVYQLVISQFTDKIEYKMLQITFGMLLTLLIAFEFRNSINSILEGRGLLVQVKIVVLIAIMALSRKFLVIDSNEYDAIMIAAYAVLTLSLGLVYWLLYKRDPDD